MLFDQVKYHSAFHLLLFCSLLLVSCIDGFVVSRRVWLRVASGASFLPHGGSCVAMAAPGSADDQAVGSKRRQGRLPRIIIFDLDGCLWRPEMYELLYFSGGKGAPFTYSPDYAKDGTLFTTAGEPVRLLGQVRDVMRELYCDKETWSGTLVGISSRTDQSYWAKELLQKFTITINPNDPENSSTETFPLQDVFTGPIEIRQDSKVNHFRRISTNTGIPLKDMLFFDNERGNCIDIAELGVAVAYCPGGVTSQLWEKALAAFPDASGKVLGLDNPPLYDSDYRRTRW